jgi:hypothetical protein
VKRKFDGKFPSCGKPTEFQKDTLLRSTKIIIECSACWKRHVKHLTAAPTIARSFPPRSLNGRRLSWPRATAASAPALQPTEQRVCEKLAIVVVEGAPPLLSKIECIADIPELCADEYRFRERSGFKVCFSLCAPICPRALCSSCAPPAGKGE